MVLENMSCHFIFYKLSLPGYVVFYLHFYHCLCNNSLEFYWEIYAQLLNVFAICRRAVTWSFKYLLSCIYFAFHVKISLYCQLFIHDLLHFRYKVYLYSGSYGNKKPSLHFNTMFAFELFKWPRWNSCSLVWKTLVMSTYIRNSSTHTSISYMTKVIILELSARRHCRHIKTLCAYIVPMRRPADKKNTVRHNYQKLFFEE